MATDTAAPKDQDTPPERRLAALRRRLAALRERARSGAGDEPEATEKVCWPRDLNHERTAPGEWGTDNE